MGARHDQWTGIHAGSDDQVSRMFEPEMRALQPIDCKDDKSDKKCQNAIRTNMGDFHSHPLADSPYSILHRSRRRLWQHAFSYLWRSILPPAAMTAISDDLAAIRMIEMRMIEVKER